MKYLDVSIYVVVSLITVIALLYLAVKVFMFINKEAQRQAMVKAFKKYHKKLIKKELYEEALISIEVLGCLKKDNYKELRNRYNIKKLTYFKFKKGEFSIILDFTFKLKK